MTEEEEIASIARQFDGQIIDPSKEEAEKEDIFSRRLTEGERKLLQQFSCLRHFCRIDRLVCRWGLTEEFFYRAQEALRELATFLPLDERQIVLFVVLYMNCEDTGSDIGPDVISRSLRMPSSSWLEQINWREMQEMGLLQADFSAKAPVFRLPERVIDAVAMVDMTFYLKLFKDTCAKATREDKTALFMFISLERIKKK